jgi:hypothetical protein
LVRTFLIGCVVLLVVGCSGTRSEAPKEKQQGYTEATNNEQGRSPEATSEEARCEGTRTFHIYYDYKAKKMRSGSEEDMKKVGKKDDWGVYTTNDLPGCPKGGPLSGTGGKDKLDGKGGDDEIRGLGDSDNVLAGPGNDVIYGGPGVDWIDGGPSVDWTREGDDGDDVIYGGDSWDELTGGEGKDALYGGDGNDNLEAEDGQPDKLYCGKGKDRYDADKKDYVDSSCEKKVNFGGAAL